MQTHNILKESAMKIKYNLLLITLLCLLLNGCATNGQQQAPSELSTKTINGKILFRDPMINGSNDRGLVLLDPFTTEITPIGFFGGAARFMDSTSKIIAEKGIGTIMLFDTDTKESSILYETQNQQLTTYNIAYAGNNRFSVVDSSKLVLINIETGEQTILTEDLGNSEHCWSGDGKYVYYSSRPESTNQINRLNTETGEKDYLLDGIRPRISKDGSLLAYMTYGLDEKLIIKELNGEKEWVYPGAALMYCFSPDGQYLAVVEYWRGPWFYDGYTVQIWDFKAGKKQTVVPRYANGQCCDIDWAY